MKNKIFAIAVLPLLVGLLAADKEKPKPVHQFWFNSAVGWDTTLYVNGNPIARGGAFNSNSVSEVGLWLRPGKNTIRMEAARLNPDKQELQLRLQMNTVDGQNLIDSKELASLSLPNAPDQKYSRQFEFENPLQQPMLWAKGDRIQKLTAEDRAAITKLIERAADALRKKNFDDFMGNLTPVWGDGDAPAGVLPAGMSWTDAKKMWLNLSKTVFAYDDYAVKFAPPETWEWSVGEQIVMISVAPSKEYPKDAHKDYGVEIVKAGHGKKNGGTSLGFSYPKFVRIKGQWKMLTP